MLESENHLGYASFLKTGCRGHPCRRKRETHRGFHIKLSGFLYSRRCDPSSKRIRSRRKREVVPRHVVRREIFHLGGLLGERRSFPAGRSEIDDALDCSFVEPPEQRPEGHAHADFLERL